MISLNTSIEKIRKAVPPLGKDSLKSPSVASQVLPSPPHTRHRSSLASEPRMLSQPTCFKCREDGCSVHLPCVYMDCLCILLNLLGCTNCIFNCGIMSYIIFEWHTSCSYSLMLDVYFNAPLSLSLSFSCAHSHLKWFCTFSRQTGFQRFITVWLWSQHLPLK